MSKNQEFDVYVDFLNYLNNTEVKKVKELAAYTKDIHKLDWSPTCIKKINAKGHQQSGMLFYAFGEVSEHWIELMVATKDAMPSHTRVGEWIDDFFINDKKGADNNGLISYVKKYIETSSCKVKEFGEVMTPISLVQDMLDKLPEEVWSNPDYKWLDPCAGIGTFASCVVPRLMEGLKNVEGLKQTQKRYNHIINNMLYACELQARNAFIYTFLMNPFKQGNKVCTNIYRGSFLDEGFDNHMKDVWELTGFDIIIGNPPYNAMLDLDFVQKCHGLCDLLMFVHPSTWLLDEKEKQEKFMATRTICKDSLKFVELFNGNGIFRKFKKSTSDKGGGSMVPIDLCVPCAITIFDTRKKQENIVVRNRATGAETKYKSIFDINKYDNNPHYLSIKEKLEKFSKFLSTKDTNDLQYWVELAQISGNHKDGDMNESQVKDDFYTLIVNKNVNTCITTSKKPKKLNQFSFGTKTEANNFVAYVCSKFARFALSIYKNNKNNHRGEVELIPYLDYTEEWTDDRLKEYFNITDDEMSFINSTIPNYYEKD